MPIPMYDAAQALKTNPEKTEEALQKVLQGWQPGCSEHSLALNCVPASDGANEQWFASYP